MSGFCTCGAELPPDARFCHKCGKPQREELVVTVTGDGAGSVAPPVVVVSAPAPLSFRNPTAIRVGLLASALLCILMMIPGINYAFLVWWLGAGYFSVWIYKRRTGQPLTVRGGAHMGWITGVLSCLLLSLLFALIMAAIQQVGGLSTLKDQLHDLAFDQRTIDEAVKRLQNPLEVLRSLAEMFLVMMLFCTAGGALGAKILSRD
jgi:hypothetical protein